MTDQRRARFGAIEGLGATDVVLAGEAWLEDVVRAPWATKEAMKLAAQILRYLSLAEPRFLSLVTMETQLQLSREEVRRSLALMQSMNAVQTFAMEKDSINAVLHLSQFQVLRVLEARQRLQGFSVAPVLPPDRTPRPAVQAVAAEAPAAAALSAA